jgi:hypothetical protein
VQHSTTDLCFCCLWQVRALDRHAQMTMLDDWMHWQHGKSSERGRLKCEQTATPTVYWRWGKAVEAEHAQAIDAPVYQLYYCTDAKILGCYSSTEFPDVNGVARDSSRCSDLCTQHSVCSVQSCTALAQVKHKRANHHMRCKTCNVRVGVGYTNTAAVYAHNTTMTAKRNPRTEAAPLTSAADSSLAAALAPPSARPIDLREVLSCTHW